MKKILSGFLAFCMVIGIIISSVPSLTVSAAKQVSPNPDLDYLKNKIATKQEKLDTMQLMLTKGNYELYYEKYTGEVAVKNTVTGDIMMTNPYDVGSASASDNVKNQLLSQIILKYTNLQGNEIQMYSYVEAALRSQIKVSYIKNGIRVEYVMGKQESRSLVPRYIEKSRFENLILANITDNARKAKLLSFYYLKDPNDSTLTNKLITEMEKKYPVTKDGMAIYVIDENSKEGELSKLEAIIKEFCPAYTYETLQEDHDMTQYESEAKNPVQFRMSLEYTLDENGLSVRLPANGIRFDQSTYTLNYIRILPYFGAGSSQFKGYTMIPDGSGALVRFEDVLEAGQSRLITGKLYGQDYAYHEIAGANQQPMRMPVFGLVENTTIKENKITEEVVPCDPTDEGVIVNEEGVVVFEETGEPATKTVTKTEAISYDRSNGWFAVIENGDSLATIGSDHGGNLTHKYNSVFTELNPRPSDSYNLGSSISVAGDATWTVVSERKYTGNYRIRYMMLTDHNYASENKLETAGLFDTDYVGMALTYRNYLEKNGMIQKLEKTSQIPLYLETLGSMDVMEKVLSVPVNVKKSLTSFEDIKTMTNELAEAGITNLVYKLTGYINGGLKRTLPTKIKVQKEVGGNKGLTDLINWGAEKGIDFFLDIDFSYAQKDKMFDGFYKKTDAVKTIDDRYTRKRTYSAVYQSFTNTGLIAVSPSIFGSIFDKAKSYLEDLGVKAVALGTLGSDLNSDFDEDDPYNREDSKENVVEALAKVKEAGYKVMIDGGNAYAVKYADHVLNAPIDSSNYTYSSETIPFFGIVYHSYLNFAGKATNMAGDIRYEKLKMLENGSNPYFILVYDNSEKLKEDETLSSYYSISYENWKEDLIAAYKQLNSALSLVTDSAIEDHEFVIGERVPSADEKERNDAEDAAAEQAKIEEEEKAKAEEERIAKLQKHLAELMGEDYEDETSETETETEVVTDDSDDTADSEGETSETEEEVSREQFDVDTKDKDYEYTRYTSDNGMIVKVSYDNGYAFILNYNMYDVTVKETGDEVIAAFGFIVVDSNGHVILNSAEEVAE